MYYMEDNEYNMQDKPEGMVVETVRGERALFSSLFRRIVQSAPDEDLSGCVLEAMGANVGADRAFVCRFLEPGKSSVCAKTHVWCAEGVKPAVSEGEARDLASYGDFNDCITSGRDYMYTGSSAVDSGSRDRLSRLGVKSLIAAPLVDGEGMIRGFAGFAFLKAALPAFPDHIVYSVHAAADLLLACFRLRDHEMAMQEAAEASERHAGTIEMLQKHQQFRADALAFAFGKEDLRGLIDMMLRRLLELTECDYIALHSVDGDHLMLQPDGVLDCCPGRCQACSFYKLNIPPVADSDSLIELADTKGQCAASIPHECPARSLEVAVVNRDGKPWGGIALHYLNRKSRISDYDRTSLKTAADVLTLALERNSAEARLKAERDRAIEAEKVRSYFFTSVSHDIRTPLNAIIGFSELLQAGGVPPDEAKQNLKMIVSSGKTLLQLVNDVLDISKMDHGRFEFHQEPSNMGDLVRETVGMFMLQAKDRNQTLFAEIPEMPRLMVDPIRFRQVLFNFIGNAVKYAGPCTIRVSVAYEDGWFKTTVADNGRGVPSEKAKLLMQPFVQADIKNRAEGSGLGLAVCKRLVEIAGGRISFETAPGKGFSICTEVPVALAPPEKDEGKAVSASKAAAGGLPKRVLVVDDSPVNRTVLKAILVKLGVKDIVLAVDGGDALGKLKGDAAFDWVLSDMWMPVMDGAGLIKNIREDAKLSHLKVCSVTADVEARETYKEQGFDSLLLKPVTIERLTALFAGEV